MAGKCLYQWQCLARLRVLPGCRRGAAGEVSSRGPEDKAAAQSSAAAGKPAAPEAEAAQGPERQPKQQGVTAAHPVWLWPDLAVCHVQATLRGTLAKQSHAPAQRVLAVCR